MHYESEEQQIEAIKGFWKENGNVIIFGAILGLGGVLGWRVYSDKQVESAELSSTQYNQALEVVVKDKELGQQQLEDVIANSDVKAYAVLAAFQAARLAVDKGDLDVAAEKLNWVLANSSVDSIKAIAQVRVARIQAQQGKAAEALATLDAKMPESYAVIVDELRGDIYVQQGETDKARMAYQAAIDADKQNTMLQMKLNQLATNTSVAG